ncbi:hypothetical protein EDB84DRAFT_1446577 [Lactarius hengduanensis]|nr:hypothetical protein EDB84DRAFT_1446577 [Lactarius hengduanensis]
MDKAFARCKRTTITGCFVADPHGRLRWSFPLLATWIADLPEQHLISAVAKSTSPQSLAVTKQFGDTQCHPSHHGQVTIKLIQDLTSRVDPWNLGTFQDNAKELGLNGVHLPFWRDWYLADPSYFLVPEILHTCHKFFFDHPLQWCINAVGTFELDSRFQSLHPCVGFHHFGNGVARVQQMTGHEHCDIQRSIIAVIAGAIPPHFLHAIRALIDFIYQVQSPFLTDSAISSFVDSLQEFHDEKAAITAAGARVGSKGPITHFNIPKLEQWQHFACSTKMMGAPIQWTANVTECLHITEVKHPFRATNHCNFEEQCARILDRLECVKLFNFFCNFLANGDLKPSNPFVAEAALTAEQDLHPVLPPAVAACEEIIMSERPMQNYFLKGLVSLNSLAAFHLKKTPDIASISIGEATRLYALQDFWPALGDFMSGLSHQQRRGRRVSRGCPDVGFKAISQTVQVLPPSQEHPHGLCDTVLIHGLGGAGESDESVQGSVAQVRVLFQPVSNKQQNNLFLCYIEKFSFAGRRAEDGSRLEEENVDICLTIRVPVSPDGDLPQAEHAMALHPLSQREKCSMLAARQQLSDIVSGTSAVSRHPGPQARPVGQGQGKGHSGDSTMVNSLHDAGFPDPTSLVNTGQSGTSFFDEPCGPHLAHANSCYVPQQPLRPGEVTHGGITPPLPLSTWRTTATSADRTHTPSTLQGPPEYWNDDRHPGKPPYKMSSLLAPSYPDPIHGSTRIKRWQFKTWSPSQGTFSKYWT